MIGSGATAVTLVPAMAKQAAHVTMLQRSPTYIVSLPGGRPDRQGRCGGCCRRRPPTRSMRWKNVLLQMAVLPAQPAPPRRRQEADPPRASSARCRPATTSTPTSRPATTPGTSACAWSPTATCSRRSATAAPSIVTDRIETFTETGICARVRRRARGGRDRHRDRAQPALPRRHGARRRRRAGRFLPKRDGLQGDDAQRRAQLRLHASATPTPPGR